MVLCCNDMMLWLGLGETTEGHSVLVQGILGKALLGANTARVGSLGRRIIGYMREKAKAGSGWWGFLYVSPCITRPTKH